MAKFERTINGDFNDVVRHLHYSMERSGSSVNLVDESSRYTADMKVAVKVYDKYFMRNKNRTSLTLTVVESSDQIFISAIGAGGGSGAIFNFSLGAEDDMVNVISKSVAEYEKNRY